MLSKIHRLRKNTDFKAVFTKGRFAEDQFVKIKFYKNSINLTRFGFVVGLKFSKKSSFRNSIKRRLRAAVRVLLKEIKPGHDIVIWPKNKTADAKYRELADALKNLFVENDLLLI